MPHSMDLNSTKVTAKLLAGQRIRDARIAKGWSLDQLAAALGMSKVSIWQWEQGQARPRATRLAEVARILGLSLETLNDEHAPDISPDREATDLLLDCQMRIAKYFGVAPEDVEIKVTFGGRSS